MKLLLDTVTFLFAAMEPEELSVRAKALIGDPENERYLSAVSASEIATKYALRKLSLPVHPDQFVPEQRAKLSVESLQIDEESALHLTRLPLLHRDPFDRLLICQA